MLGISKTKTIDSYFKEYLEKISDDNSNTIETDYENEMKKKLCNEQSILNNKDENKKLIEDKLKWQLTCIENERIMINDKGFSNIVFSVMAFCFSAMSIIVNIYNKSNDLISNIRDIINEYKTNVSKPEIDKALLSAEKIKDLKELVSQNTELINYISFIVLLFIAISIWIIIKEGKTYKENAKRKVALNIYESEIKKQLYIIEQMKKNNEKRKIQEKQAVLINQLIDCLNNKNDSELVKAACDKIINKMF